MIVTVKEGPFFDLLWESFMHDPETIKAMQAAAQNREVVDRAARRTAAVHAAKTAVHHVGQTYTETVVDAVLHLVDNWPLPPVAVPQGDEDPGA